MTITIKEAHEQAVIAAKEAASNIPDGAYCGFAWIEVKGDLRSTNSWCSTPEDPMRSIPTDCCRSHSWIWLRRRPALTGCP